MSMTNHLGWYFRGRRLALGWSLGEVARRLGYRNLSKAANKVQRFERDGLIHDDLLRRLAALYGVEVGVVKHFAGADYSNYLREWKRWAYEPVPARVVLRAVPGFMVAVPVPDDATTQEEVVAHARTLAVLRHKRAFVALSRRQTVAIAEDGEIDGHHFAKPESDPCPGMSRERVRLLMRFSGAGGTDGDGS